MHRYVIQINDPADFVGGGTKFEHAKDAVVVPQGCALLATCFHSIKGPRVSMHSLFGRLHLFRSELQACTHSPCAAYLMGV